MVRWTLAEYMDARGITRYALQKQSGVPMNTLRAMYAQTSARVDFVVLDRVLIALSQLSETKVSVSDVLEHSS